jgi:hypothetical protein
MDQPTIESGDQDMRAALAGLPAPVREFLAAGQCAVFAQAYMARYALHIDQTGALERGLIALLMGAETPAEFAISLIEEMKISRAASQQIIDDVNTEIIAPLEEKMRERAAAPPVAPAKAEPVVPVLAQKPQQQSAPKPVMPPVPQAMKAPPPANLPGTPLADALKRAGAMAPAAPRPMQAPAPKPATLLEDHEEPHINIGGAAPMAPKPAMPSAPPQWNAPQPPKPLAPTAPPPMPAMPKPVPAPAPAPMPRPAPPPPMMVPPVQKPPMPAAPAMPQSPKPPPPPVPKPAAPDKYSADPYREPIDDK